MKKVYNKKDRREYYEDKMIVVDSEELSYMVAQYIDENLENNLSVDELCHNFNISKNKLYRKFHTYSGTTVNEYIVSKRIEKAKALLADTSFSIDTIGKNPVFRKLHIFIRFSEITQAILQTNTAKHSKIKIKIQEISDAHNSTNKK